MREKFRPRAYFGPALVCHWWPLISVENPTFFSCLAQLNPRFVNLFHSFPSSKVQLHVTVISSQGVNGVAKLFSVQKHTSQFCFIISSKKVINSIMVLPFDQCFMKNQWGLKGLSYFKILWCMHAGNFESARNYFESLVTFTKKIFYYFCGLQFV